MIASLAHTPTQTGALALPVVKANGFTVASDAGALGGDGDLHLLSLLGRKPAVEAVAATLLTGKAALVYPEALRSGLEARAPLTWSFRQLVRALQTGDAHLLLLPARCDIARVQEPSFTLLHPLDPAGTAVSQLHYLFLSRAIATPLDGGWHAWLWARALAREEATPLRTWGALPAAWSCRPDEEALRADILAALAGERAFGPLPVPGRAAVITSSKKEAVA